MSARAISPLIMSCGSHTSVSKSHMSSGHLVFEGAQTVCGTAPKTWLLRCELQLCEAGRRACRSVAGTWFELAL